jgi:hypothetical protein
MQPSSSIFHTNILKTVAYFDIFEYPLTAEQIFFFLSSPSQSVEGTSMAADALVLEEKLKKKGQYFFLPATNKNIVENRISNEKRAKKMLAYARIIGAFIKRVPFVRGVFITGSLSKNVAALSSDIDFMVVTASERLWICKTFLTVFRKVFLFGKSKFFCTNFYVTENGFTLSQRNFYTAIEVVTTKAIWNESAFYQYQRDNYWTRNIFPNAEVKTDADLLISSSQSRMQYITELLLGIFPLTPLDRRLMESFRTHWKKVFKHLSEEQMATRFIISPDISSNWPDDRQGPILREYHDRLALLGLQ